MLKQYLVRSKIPKFFFYKESVLKRIKNCFQFSKLNINIYSTRLTGSFAHPFLEIILALTVPLKVGHFKSFSNDGKFYFRIFTVLFWGHVRSHKKFGPDRFRRSNDHRLQTNKQQTDSQTSKTSIYTYIFRCFVLKLRIVMKHSLERVALL